MKYLINSFFLISFFISNRSLADKMSLETHLSLINKIESVLSLKSEDSMIEKNQIKYRLADLYAEKARLLSLENQGKLSPELKKEIDAARFKSIELFNQIIPSFTEQKSNLLSTSQLQKAHLLELLNKPDQATNIYLTITENKKDYDTKSLAIAYIKLADNAFNNNQYKEAESLYTTAIKITNNPRMNYCWFKYSWSLYNQGNTEKAEEILFSILEKKNLNDDEVFQEEVRHDLASFIAQNNINEKKINRYIKINNKQTQAQHLIYLAKELERKAKKQSALLVWSKIGTTDLSFEDIIERQTQLTQISFDLNQKINLYQNIKKLVELLNDTKCVNNSTCQISDQQLKKILVEWAKSEKNNVSNELLSSFKIYLSKNTDYEMSLTAASLALRKANASASKNEQTSTLQMAYFFFDQVIAELSTKNKTALQNQIFEDVLIKKIELAEKLNLNKIESLELYLKINPKGKNSEEVKFKIAYENYQKNNLSLAYQQFSSITGESSFNKELRIKAADLILDIDVLNKDDEKLQVDALQLASKISEKKQEYTEIFKKSVFNQTYAILKNEKKNELVTQLQKLNKIPEKQLNESSQFSLNMLKIEIYKKIHDSSEVQKISLFLLNNKNISIENKNLVIDYAVWSYQVEMKFVEALKYLQMKVISEQNKSKHLNQIAALKELAEKNPYNEFKDLFEITKNKKEKQFYASKLIAYSKNPQIDFKKYSKYIFNKSLLNDVAFNSFLKSKNKDFGLLIMNNLSFKKSSYALFVDFYLDQINLLKKLNKYKSNKTLIFKAVTQFQNDLSLRISNLTYLEKIVKNNISRLSLYSQIASLNFVQNQSLLLSNELNNIHFANIKNPEIKKQLETALVELKLKYKNQSLQIQQKVIQIASSPQFIDSLSAQLSFATTTSVNKWLEQELSSIRSSIENCGGSTVLFEKLSENRQKLFADAKELKQHISKKPFDFSMLQKSKEIETQLNNGTMVAYLDSRLSELSARGGIQNGEHQ